MICRQCRKLLEGECGCCSTCGVSCGAHDRTNDLVGSTGKESFNPATGEWYRFGPRQTPPTGWKPLLPVPPRDPFLPAGSTVTYIPGREPKLYVNPNTAESKWISWYEQPPTGWIQLVARWTAPPLTTDAGQRFDPLTGESHWFDESETPPSGWKPVLPVPPREPWLPPGSTVTYIPGEEPRLFVDPATGTPKWVYFGQQPPDGWKPIRQIWSPPPLSGGTKQFFDPQTGEWYIFGPKQIAPTGWKPLTPIPPEIPGAPPGSTVTFIPGKEPKLFVDPNTGTAQWVYSGQQPPAGWKPLVVRTTKPPLTTDTGEFFNPQTGEWYRFGPGLTPPEGWKPMQPIPPANPAFPPGTTVTYIPGREPRLFVDPNTGQLQWVYFDQEPPAGWRLVVPRYTQPAMTADSRTYVDSNTGGFHVEEVGGTPPTGWIKLKPIPAANPCLPPGSTVTWLPGMEPSLYVNPQTGDVQWVPYNQTPPPGWLLLGVDSAPPLPVMPFEYDELERLRSRRLIHLIQLARERGVIYSPEGDVAIDEVYEAEMERLGYMRDPDTTSLSGWVDIPPPPPPPPPPSPSIPLESMGRLDRLYWAVDELIRSGKLGKDFYDALPDPHAFALGLLALTVLQFVPGIDLVLDAYLVYMFGSQIFDLADALSALMTADSVEEFQVAIDSFGKALAGIAVDTLIAIASWGYGKWRSTAKPPARGPRVPKVRGLKDLTEEELMRGNGGHRPGYVPREEYYPELPRPGKEPRPEKLPYDLEPTRERTPRRERTRSRGYSLRPHGHHTFPKYIGGEYAQELKNLRPYFHEEYHRGLREIIPERGPSGGGSSDYVWMRIYRNEQYLGYIRKLVEYTRKFDRQFKKKLLPKLLDQLEQQGIWGFR